MRQPRFCTLRNRGRVVLAELVERVQGHQSVICAHADFTRGVHEQRDDMQVPLAVVYLAVCVVLALARRERGSFVAGGLDLVLAGDWGSRFRRSVQFECRGSGGAFRREIPMTLHE